MSLVTVDPTNEVAVITFLQTGVTALSEALDRTDIAGIATIKAQAATVETATKQLSLSKESQEFATELVRRSEWTLGRAVKAGQEQGLIRPHGGSLIPGARTGGLASPSSSLPSPKSFYASQTEYEDATAMAHADADEFTETVKEALSEGNASRTAVARKVRERRADKPASRSPETRQRRADMIVALANQGYSSRQMPAKVGVSEETVRQIARDYDIDIPADRSVSRTRRINSTQVVVNTATALEGLVSGIELIDYDALDVEEVRQWATSLTDSLRELRRFLKQIQEMTQ